MTIHKGITVAQTDYLCEALMENMSSDTLERGLHMYLRGAVSRGNIVEGDCLYKTKVLDVKENKVEIDYEFFAVSTCTCGDDSFCVHIAAACLELYARSGRRPEAFVKRVREMDVERKAMQDEAERKKSRKSERQARTLTTSKTKTSAPGLDESSSTEQWSDYFARTFAHYQEAIKRNAKAFVPKWIEEMERTAHGWKKPIADLFKLNMLLDAADRLEQASKGQIYPFIDYWQQSELRYWSVELMARTLNHASSMNSVGIQELYAVHLEHIAQLLHKAALVEGTLQKWDVQAVGWLLVYRYLWWNVLRADTLREREKARLQRELKRNTIHVNRKDLLLVALLHIEFVEGREEAIMARFEELHNKEPGYICVYAVYYMQMKELDKHRRLLKWMAAYMKGSALSIDEYLLWWEKLIDDDVEDKDFTEAVTRLLPHSFRYCSNLLYQGGHFRHWVDLCMTTGYTPLQFSLDVHRKLESKAPELLIPWYHQSVEQFIMDKKRESYAIAVKMLVKLKGLYTKIKRTDRWETYLAYTIEQHSRLRAFQEELKKGKLLL